jgi:hypothetical protein
MAGRHACDPTGTKVHFLDHNFPKLIQLSFKGSKAHATRTLAALRSGNFDERDYAYDSHRFMTLFWIPDVIKNPDAIQPNVRQTIEGDEIYVKRFAKAGPPFKLIFTGKDRGSGHRIVTTAFFTTEDRLALFAGLPARWVAGT